MDTGLRQKLLPRDKVGHAGGIDSQRHCRRLSKLYQSTRQAQRCHVPFRDLASFIKQSTHLRITLIQPPCHAYILRTGAREHQCDILRHASLPIM